MTLQNDHPWHGAYKIPWDNPDFSRRMLAEHLSQDHDLASRRTEWIDAQVAWLHDHLLAGRPARILDLGCGPGLYSHRLAARGHRCYGIDFGPASIEYARQHKPAGAACEFVLADVRRAPLGGPYDLAMMLYGEMNVFSPAEARDLLGKVRESLAPGGRLILEVQTPEAVARTGRGAPHERQCESGLFSDRPHRVRTVSQWLPEPQVAVQTFIVTETDTGRRREFRNTTRAWPGQDLVALLVEAGFAEVSPQASWPSNTEDLMLWMAAGG